MRFPAILSFVSLLACSGMADAADTNAAPVAKPNAQIAAAVPNQWLKLHEQAASDTVRFSRQQHGGGCFDSRRNRIVLFGSNTHGKDWTNSPLLFDVATCTWSRLYPNDEKPTYKADAQGQAVAGVNGDHPWATHTFGSVAYDPGRDEMVVCCYPRHMTPGRFSDALADVWGTVKRFPTWTFRFADKKWTPLPCNPMHFFPNAVAWDSDRKVVVGYGEAGVWELGGEPREWKKVFDTVLCGHHNNAVYDAKNKAVLVFGSNENSNDMIVYRPENKEHRKMPTPGVRPPKDQHCPMCFEPAIGRTVVLVDHVPEKGQPGEAKTEVWLYDLAGDAWQQITAATLPFACGMNYTFYYDPVDKACLLVVDPPNRPVTVMALKVELTKSMAP